MNTKKLRKILESDTIFHSQFLLLWLFSIIAIFYATDNSWSFSSWFGFSTGIILALWFTNNLSRSVNGEKNGAA